ncbi:MAG: hypothetical protein HOQ09_01640 [Gemmatimonadaceae bacterium]|nr:hypothetical protein [Gemmatimonadaceae bacterium]
MGRKVDRLPSVARLAGLLAIAVVASCRDRVPSGPGLPSRASLAVVPRLQPAAAGGGSTFISLRKVRGILAPLDGGPSSTAEAGFVNDTATLAFDVTFPGRSRRYSLALAAIDTAGDTLFRSTREITASPGASTLVHDTLKYVAPDSAVAAIILSVSDTLILGVDTLAVSAAGVDAQRRELSPLYIRWSTSDSTSATIVSSGPSTGRIAARDVDRVVWIIARAFNGVADSISMRIAARVARVHVVPDTLALLVGDSARFGVVVSSARGDTLTGRPLKWASVDPALVQVGGAGGAVHALAPGTTAVVATSPEGAADTAWVRVVSQALAVVRTDVSPKTVHLLGIGDSAQLVARSYASDSSLTPGHYSWSVRGGVGVVSVDSLGHLIALAIGSAWVVATEQKGTADSAQVTVDLPTVTLGAMRAGRRVMSGISTGHRGTGNAFDGGSRSSSSAPILRGCSCPRSLIIAPSATSSGARVKSASATRTPTRSRSWTSSR